MFVVVVGAVYQQFEGDIPETKCLSVIQKVAGELTCFDPLLGQSNFEDQYDSVELSTWNSHPNPCVIYNVCGIIIGTAVSFLGIPHLHPSRDEAA